MSYQRVTLAMLLGVSMVLSMSSVSAQEESAAKQSSLESQLLGTWLFAGKPGSNESPKPNATMRFWGAQKFVILRVDPETGAVVNCHGGTYHIDGDTYQEKIEFANEKRKLLIGGQFKYRIKVEGDVYTQEGIGNDFNERWVRQTTDVEVEQSAQAAKPVTEMTEFTVETVKPQAVMSIRCNVSRNSPQIIAKFGQSLSAVLQHLKDNGVQPSGPPFGRYHGHEKNEIDLEVGFPVAKVIAAKGNIRPSELPGGEVVTTVHVGPFTRLSKLHRAIREHVHNNGLTPRGGLWESLLVGPYQERDPNRYKTKLYLPVQDTKRDDAASESKQISP